ncbi:MAG: hypothetical protein GXY05_03460 [Clostridiales bacterium]|nr:hypothetical protein [Clostridiales bacterium]
MQFHETVMGRRFFEAQLPALIKALEQIAENGKRIEPPMPRCRFCSNYNNGKLSVPCGACNRTDGGCFELKQHPPAEN